MLGRLGCTGAFSRRTELGVRLKNRRPLFTVKNWAADKKPYKVMSAGCTTCNIYNRHTQYLQLKTSKTHMWFKYTCSNIVACSQAAKKYLGMQAYTCGARWNQVQQTRTGCGKHGNVRPSSTAVALRSQRRVGLLGTGTEWEGGERVKGSTAETARKRPE